jgi:predicted porin
MNVWRIRWRHAWLATGIAIAAPIVHAQSSLTLYGIADAGVLYTSRSTGTTARQFSFADGGWSSDILGFRGAEDLGGQLQAQFDLQSGYGLGAGGFKFSNGGLFGRQSWVGLASDRYGTVKAGMQFSPFFLAIAATDPRGFAQVGSGLITYADNFSQTGVFSGNSVSYASPLLGGLQASASYTFGGVPGDFANGRQYSGRVQYTLSGFVLNVAILKSEGGNGAGVPPATNLPAWGRTIGVSYTFGGLTARASFTSYKRGGLQELGNTNVYAAGLSYLPVPEWLISGGVWVSRDRNNDANNSVLASAGAQYLLSKRSSLYAQLAWVNNHGVMGTGLAVSGTNNLAGLPAGPAVAANIGMKHTF